MPLSRGARLGPYRIDAELGAGGMGEVFRATDTRLDRAVAIKVLPAGRWAEPELRHRFEREARALSSLNHPNLCALYDVGELTFKGLAAPYLVMELLEGESLRQRIDTAKSLPVRKSLQWAAQIANGLAAAHQKGVIHRDLKPENVFVVSGELLKILDFGLARDANTSDSAATHMRTQTGMVMGTAEYMSPEQARGATVGPQSDIFSLGIVLYEMLTGRTPFHKGSSVETMHAVLVDEVPEMAASGFNIPEHVEALVRRCLEKDPAQRFSSANDLAFALENAARSVTTTTQSTRRRLSAAARGVVSRTRVAVLLGALATVGAAFVLTPRLRHEPSPEPPRLRTLTYSGRDGAPAASRDGRFLAFVSTRDGTRRVWVKQLSDGTEAALTAGPDDTAPRFSPDGSRILFTRVENGGSAIYQVAVVGGEPRKLIENGFDGDWSPDGTRIAFLRNRSEETRLATLCVARVDGGTVQELAAEAQYEMAAPRWSPNGRWIAVTRNPRANASGSLLLVDPESKETKTLAREERHGLLSGVAWTPDGRSVVYAELEALNSTGLAEKRGSSAVVQQNIASGDARILLRNPHSAADTVDILASGGLVFSEDMTRQNLQEIWLDGSHAPRWITRGMSVDRQPAWARDGRSVVFTSDRGGNVDLWELTLDIGTLRRITDHERIDWDPHPARNGGALYWSSDRGGHFEVWTASLEGVGAHQVTRDGIEAQNPSLPFDAQWVYYDSTNPKADGLWRVPAAGGEATIVVAAETIHPEVSHDGEYVVYQRPETGGSMALDVVRVRDGSVYTLASGISGMGTLRARWIGSGHTVAFRAAGEGGRPALFSQEFIPDANTRGSRRQLTPVDFDNSLETYAVSPDGRRVILSVVDEASAIMVAEGVVW